MRNVKILWTVIGLVLVCMLYFISTRSHQEETPDRVIARIGQYHITYQQLHNKLEQQYGKELLNHILDNEATAQKAAALGLRVNDKEITEELKRMQLGYDSEEQFYTSMRVQLGLSKSDIKTDIVYRLLLEKIATYQIVISNEAVDQYISEHADEYSSQTKVHLWQIIIKSEAEAENVIKELLGGADFNALAKEKSTDELTSAEGGDLGWVEMNDPFIQEDIMKAANILMPGEISTPIKVPEGYAVVKVVEREVPNPEDEAKLKESVRKELALSQAVPIKQLLTSIRKELGTVILDPNLK